MTDILSGYNNAETDARIRAALKKADTEGVLEHVADNILQIAGGAAACREIMNSNEPLCLADRVMIGMHLKG